MQAIHHRIYHIFHHWWLKSAQAWHGATLDERLVALVAVTLPLERVPAVDIAGMTLRPSIVFGGILIVRWFIKTDWPTWWRGLSKIEWLLLAFGAWYVLRLLPVAAVKPGIQTVLPTVYVILLALSIRSAVRIAKLQLIVAAILIGAVAASLFGLYQFIGDFAGLPNWLTAMRSEYEWQRFGFPRVLSTALEPLFFGAYLLLPVSLVLTYFGHSEARNRRLGLLVVAILLIGTDILTVSRGALLALALLLFVVAVFIAMSGRSRAAFAYFKRLAFVVAVALCVGIGFLAVFNRPGQDSDVTYQSRGVTTFIRHLLNTRITANQTNLANEDSVAARWSARDYAVDTVTASPQNFIFGVGPGQYQTYNARTNNRPDIVVANVLPVDIMLHVGAIGLTLLGGALVLLFIRLLQAVRNQHMVASALAAYLLAIGLQSLTFPTLYITHLWFAIGLALLVALPLTPSRQTHQD